MTSDDSIIPTDIDQKLLAEQEQWDNEKENLRNAGSDGGNGHANIVEEVEVENKEGEDDDEKLASIILTKQDIDFMFDTMMKESKYDELSIKQTVHGLNSAFSKLPIPHVSTSKESGAGKSYIVNHIAGFYPDKYITRLAGVSDKALFHLDGPMIIVKDEETREFEYLGTVVSELEIRKEECEEQINTEKQLKTRHFPNFVYN